jgi:hypothetical protein
MANDKTAAHTRKYNFLQNLIGYSGEGLLAFLSWRLKKLSGAKAITDLRGYFLPR